jgi:hypothetical protein
LFAPLSIDTPASPGTALAPGTVLGKSRRGGFGLAVRKLRPKQTLEQGASALDDAHSIALDPRNVLPLLAP